MIGIGISAFDLGTGVTATLALAFSNMACWHSTNNLTVYSAQLVTRSAEGTNWNFWFLDSFGSETFGFGRVAQELLPQLLIFGEFRRRKLRNCSNFESCRNATVGFLPSDLVPRMTL